MNAAGTRQRVADLYTRIELAQARFNLSKIADSIAPFGGYPSTIRRTALLTVLECHGAELPEAACRNTSTPLQ